jgi:transposase
MHGLRAILDAVFYILKSGCHWRLLPRDFPAMEDRLRLVQEVAHRRYPRAPQRRPARAAADSFGQELAPQRGHRRLAVHEDYRRGRRTEGLRRRKEGSGQKAPPARGHRGLGHEGQGPQRKGTRPGWLEAATGLGTHGGVGAEAPLAGCRLPREGKRWAEEVLGLNVEVVRKPPKPVPEEVARIWAAE